MRWSHTSALHGSTMDVFYNPLVVYPIDGLMHLMHAFLWEVCGPHRRHRMGDTRRSRTWPHHAVDGTWGRSRSWTGPKNWPRGRPRPWRRPWVGHRTRVCGRGHLLLLSLPVSRVMLENAEQKGARGSRSLGWRRGRRTGTGLRAAALGPRHSPRPGPRRRRFLPRARHVTAIKHVCVLCALRCCDFLILRRSRAHTHTFTTTRTRHPHQPSPPNLA